jgi:hypothetical protein
LSNEENGSTGVFIFKERVKIKRCNEALSTLRHTEKYIRSYIRINKKDKKNRDEI